MLKAVLVNETMVLIPARITYAGSTGFREESTEGVVDRLRIRLAAGGAHDLAHEEFKDALIAGFEFGDIVWILGDDFVGSGFDGGIADLGAKAFGRDDVRGGAARFKHGGENFFADGGGDFAGLHQGNQLRERFRADGTQLDFLAGIVEAAKKFGLHPVGGSFAGSAGFHDGFEIIGEGSGGGEDFGVVGSDAISRDETGAFGFGEFGERAKNFFAPNLADVNGKKIRLREIAIVVSFFLGAHGDGVAFGLIPEARFLREAASGLEHADVALDFVFKRFL